MFEIIDSHCHIYPEKIADKAVSAIGEFYHLTMKNNGRSSDLLCKMDACGISKSLIFSVATTTRQVSSINNFIAENVALHPDRFAGFGTLHPDSENIESEVEEIISLGLIGVKLHPDFQHFELDCDKAMKIYEVCEGRLPILFHCGDDRYDYSNPERMKKVLESFKNLSVIGAHFGGYTLWEEAAQKLSGYDNFTVDCSSSFSLLSKERSMALIEKYGADRVMFASDYPMWNADDEINYLLSLNLPNSDLEKIFSLNAKRIIGI